MYVRNIMNLHMATRKNIKGLLLQYERQTIEHVKSRFQWTPTVNGGLVQLNSTLTQEGYIELNQQKQSSQNKPFLKPLSWPPVI